ncbi:mitochondrial cardiolipin hydrolase isoform X2 [Boleophthalmus pectinirostris]|nr:mitochondrial cardiolipin hydrolase isoform X2 [Boleophthalmus pectinirostris]
MWTVKVIGFSVLAASVSVELLNWLRRRYKARKTLNEVIFFPSELGCVEHLLRPSLPYPCYCALPHGVETSLSRLLRHILSASSSLDLCVFSFSNMDLCRAVLALHQKGVIIRVLSDKQYIAISGSQIGPLRQAGICVRSDVGSVYMHHKFALVDGSILITGSLNWTLTAVQGNMENLIVTMEPELVRPYIQEFNRLWEINDPLKHPNSVQAF